MTRTLPGFGQPLQLNVTATPSTCGNINGNITFHPFGGTPPYTYAFGARIFQSSSYLLVAGPSTAGPNPPEPTSGWRQALTRMAGSSKEKVR